MSTHATTEARAEALSHPDSYFARLRASHEELKRALELAVSWADFNLRMWPVAEIGSVEHTALSVAAEKYRQALRNAEQVKP